MKYLNDDAKKNKMEKLIQLFNELVKEFNNISKNSFNEISTDTNLVKVCDQINLLKKNIFITINKIYKKREIEDIFKKLTKNSTKKEKDFLADAFYNFNTSDSDNKFKNKFFIELNHYYDELVSKKMNLLNVINSFAPTNDKSLLLDLNSEIKILEGNITKFQESNKLLYFNLSNHEKETLKNQTNSINVLNSQIYTYFSKLKSSNFEMQDDINLYMNKLNKINSLYISLKSKFDEVISDKDYFLNLKFKRNLPMNEKYEIIDSKVNQIKWEYNFKLFEIKSSFELSNTNNFNYVKNNSIDQIKLKIRDIEDMIYSLLNEKTDYLKIQLKQFLGSNKYQEDNSFVPTPNSDNEKLLEKKVNLLENQLQNQLNKINNENSTFLLNVESKLSNLSTNDNSDKIENKILHFSNEFKDLIVNLSNEIIDLKEKVSDNGSRPNVDIDALSKKIDDTLENIDAKNTFKNFSIDEFINLFNINLRESLEDTINKIQASYKEQSQIFYSEISRDSQKYKDDIISKVADILSKNLEKSNSLVDKLSNKIIDFKNDQKLAVRENNKIIFSILKNNENEKAAIKNLLKKISDKNDEISDEAQINKLFFHNSKLMELDELIKNQNDSFLNFLNDKEKMYFEVEKILLDKNKNEKSVDKLERIEAEIQKIHTAVNSKIESVEKSFIERFDFINRDYMDEIKVSNKIFANDFEIAIFEHISNTESKLLNNFADIKTNILSVISQVNGEIEAIKTTQLSLPDLDKKLLILASKIEEIKIIEQEESVTNLNFEEIKSMLSNTSFSLEEKLSQINLLQNNISKNISNELHLALDKNNEIFLSDIQKNLIDNTNETLLSIDNRLAKIGEEEKNIPEQISRELFSILDKNNEKFLSGLNKSLEINKNETIDISNKIYEELNRFRSDQSDFIEGNKNWFKIIIQNNDNNKFYIKKLLDQLNNKNEELAIELQASKLTFHNNKLFELEGLIAKQTDDVSSLIQEKTKIYDEMERILTSKKSKENNEEKLHRIESEISNINSNFENKFKYLQDNLIDKFDLLNKQYIEEIESESSDSDSILSKEIFDNINTIENKLLENFDSVQMNIATSIKSISEQVELLKNNSLSEKEVEKKLIVLVESIKDLKKIDESNLSENIIDDANLDTLNSDYKKIANDLYKQISHSMSFDNKEILDKINQEFVKINNEFNKSKSDSQNFVNKVYEEINKFKSEQKQLILKNKDWFQSMINTNNIEKKEINELLKEINSDKSDFTNDSEIYKWNIYVTELSKLEELIIQQNTSLVNLIEEKEIIYGKIQNVLITKKEDEVHADKLKRISIEIDDISSKFIFKIRELKEKFNISFSSIEDNISNEILNLDGQNKLENKISNLFIKIKNIKDKLFDNFDLINDNIASTIFNINNQISNVIKTSIVEKEIENKLFHLAQQIEDIKVFELSNILSELTADNNYPAKKIISENLIYNNNYHSLKVVDHIDNRVPKNTNELITAKFKNILFIYDINKIEAIIEISNFFYKFENKNNELLKLFNDSLNNICFANSKLVNEVYFFEDNKYSEYEYDNKHVVSNEIGNGIYKLIDKQNSQINSFILDRNLILEQMEKLILLKKPSSYFSSHQNDEFIKLKKSSETKINYLIADLSRQFNLIINNISVNESDLNKVSYIEKTLLNNLLTIKKIVLSDFDESEINIISFKNYLCSFSKKDEMDKMSDGNAKKMSNNNNYDLKLIDNVTMENIIFFENKKNEIKNFYRKLRNLDNKH